FALCEHQLVSLTGIPQDVKAIKYERPELSSSNFSHGKGVAESQQTTTKIIEESTDELNATARSFVHLHVHSQYSVGIMQSTSEVASIVAHAAALGSEEFPPTIALTDHGNMMAAFQFVAECQKQKVKAIVGCEVNLCRDMHDKTHQDNGYQIPLLAMNKKGYHNLAMLSSLAHTQGQYYVPRIDRNTILQYKDDIIVLSGGLFGEVSYKILNEGEEKAEEALLWWHEHFGDRFYVELIRHGLDEENHVNRVLLELCAKHNIRYVAGNSSYYTKMSDSKAQDALVCVREGEFLSRPKKYVGKRGRDFRFGLTNDEYYLKSGAEMSQLFQDLPDAILETRRLADRC
ncbi:MAG: PHP domain-containing protein, partial [Flavobacteriales bacterium]